MFDTCLSYDGQRMYLNEEVWSRLGLGTAKCIGKDIRHVRLKPNGLGVA